MAKEINMQFSGQIGPLVGCLRYGKYYYRSRPATVKQSRATQASSSIFGLASTAGKIIRHGLVHSIPNSLDMKMQQQLAGCISKWLRLDMSPQSTTAIPFVHHFNFNPARPLEETMLIPLEFIPLSPGTCQLQIPAFVPVTAIKTPAHTTQVECCISAVVLAPGGSTSTDNTTHTLTVPYTDELQAAQDIPLPLQTQPGYMVIVALRLRYIIEKGTGFTYAATDKEPAAIIAAVYL